MKIFAIGDLHLPGGDDKAMDVFGAHWADHFTRIAADWRARVTPRDVVLVPGDISWAMDLAGALPDLLAIGALPGRKVLLRGNHDYWWSSLTQVRAALPAGMYALQNDALLLDGRVFCGTRGWVCPGDPPQSEEDARIYRREVLRLDLSLRAAARVAPGVAPVALMHFPPCNDKGEPSGFTALLEAYGAAALVYGHLHGAGLKHAAPAVWAGIPFYQVSCDGLGFVLREVEIA
ncbi:MAG: metallophosphoesterase [Oscillospiraceae bacterium]|jgi:predicted phosphohydrolase|nr:metallophosphoesterase [Oscillospiraceae bacterium]